MDSIEYIIIADSDHLADSWFKSKILDGLNGDSADFVDPSSNDSEYGIVAVDLITPNGVMRLD